jgi:ABC-type branched-subunit amino acid transport system ATPase component
MKTSLEIIHEMTLKEAKKIELQRQESQLVELGTIDDIKKQLQELQKQSNLWQSSFFKLVQFKSSILDIGNKYITEMKKAETLKDKAIKQISALGLNVSEIKEIGLIDEMKSDVDPILVSQVLRTIEDIKTTK